MVGRQALIIARFVSTIDHMAGLVSSPLNMSASSPRYYIERDEQLWSSKDTSLA